MAVISTFVCVDDEHAYPAVVDPTERWNGWVNPGFAIEAVCQLAAHTEEMAEEFGHDCTDQIKVIEGGPVPVVLHIRWQYLGDEPGSAANVVEPDKNGLYWIGGYEWTWYIVEDGPLFYSKKAAFNAWVGMLDATARRIGEVGRSQMPDALAAIVDLHGLGHIQAVASASGNDWPSETEDDGEDEYGPFDTETLGEGDELLRKALDFGRDPIELEMGGWRLAREIGPGLHRIVFGPLDAEPAGDGPLETIRERFTEARRKLLTDYVPTLAEVSRDAVPGATGVVASRISPRRLLWFTTSDEGVRTRSISIPADKTQVVIDRLSVVLAYEPTTEDLAACGWKPVDGQEDIDAHLLFFPAA
ncbi:hypothetical protein E0L36_22020 [Streptomyces sp. AJS327]|uniref:hypothetical protein n=1 Tax=Streptomyces sp. AJS327 TaxID=2545265 RepID=UPI0015DEBE40|nr:hypothetical protein [Streptomyces sp. AJS327]MBA0053454.1 hypothetical protein [Streptomyces sp. AJS327]